MQLIVSAVHQLDDSRQFGFRFNLDMNGADVRVNGNGLTSMAEGVEDPDILAAIAASKQDHQGEEENDPAVLAAIEASKQETVSEESSVKPVEEKEPKKESKGPILMFSTLGRSTEPYDEEDDTFDSHVTEEEPIPIGEGEEGKEQAVCDNDGDVAEPGDLDPDDAELPPVEPGNGDESGSGGGGRKKKEDFLTPTLRRAYITKVVPLQIQSEVETCL